MRTLTSLLPSLTCVGGMATCMWLMSRGHGRETAGGGDETEVGRATAAEVTQLSDEVERLRAELNARPPERTR
jgi:hypothetical protein